MKLLKLSTPLLFVILLSFFAFSSCSNNSSSNSSTNDSLGNSLNNEETGNGSSNESTGSVSKEDTVKILAIGNSFSMDALEHYLHGLTVEDGYHIIIGNMYIGGATLEQHWENASQNKADYSYRKIAANGTKITTPNTSIEEVLSDENWNYISFQQVSYKTGMYNTYVTPLPKLFDYVKQRATNPDVKFIFHQIWAYAKHFDKAIFGKYDFDQLKMFHAIVDAVWKAPDLVDIDLIVPAGTAIQNARTSSIGDHFNRDGRHLNKLGQYTASCVWFESLFGKSVVGNTYIPEGLTKRGVVIAQHAAHEAEKNPKEVTDLSDLKTPSESLTAAAFVGFGSATPVNGNWNILTGNGGAWGGASLSDLLDKNGDGTGISLGITKRFNSINSSGTKQATASFDIPANVSHHSYYGNVKKKFGNADAIVAESEITLSGLEKSKKYNFSFYASRMSTSDNRTTTYTIQGKNTETVSLNVAENTGHTADIQDVQPDADGNVSITITAGAQNDNSYGFYYLGALRISPSK